ncbi:MAG: adenylyl-sulfate kinase [Polyangiaceae bacterium]|nr:adenylyl-sulfate kinase [Polyangiaceae bacterium]
MSTGSVVWMTGRSGAGKSTLGASLVSASLRTVLLDGDIIREHISSDLGYDKPARSEHARRVAGMARMLADQGFHVIVTLISPFAEDRQRARGVIGADRFLLVYVKAHPETCERRDPKGLYARARQGSLQNLIGFPYEEPTDADVIVNTDEVDPEEGASMVRRRIGTMRGRAGI